jgi:glycosyltransferase involved in cell wall biosynthesis
VEGTITESEESPLAGMLLHGNIPVYIPVFNNPTYLRNMVPQLQRLAVFKIIVVDNASTYPPMLRALRELPVSIKVVRLKENKGPRFIVDNTEFYSALPQHFCLTDPDLEFNSKMPPDFMLRLLALTHKFGVGKVGLAIDISEPATLRDIIVAERDGKKYKVWEWEAKYWQDRIGETDAGDPVYRADTDTTFAVYNKQYFRRANFFSAIRVAGRYVCRHLPWYKANKLNAKEELVYRDTQKFSSFQR